MAEQHDWEDDQTIWEYKKEDDRYDAESSERWAKITTGLMQSKALGRLIERIEAPQIPDYNDLITDLLTQETVHPYGQPKNPTRSGLGYGSREFLKRDCMVSIDGIGDGFITAAELQRTIQIYKRKNNEKEARISEEMLQKLKDGNYDAKDYLPDELQDINRKQRRWAVLMMIIAYEGDTNRPDWGDITEQVIDDLRQACRVCLRSENAINEAMKDIDEIKQRLGFL